jgi:hypothetical protein
MERILFYLISAFALLVSGCGYTLQTSQGVALKAEGVQRIYIAPIKNKSFKPGVENLAYNKLVQAMAAGRRVRLVDHASEADAILEGIVIEAAYSPSNTTSADSIYPLAPGRTTINIPVATEYLARVACSFKLKRTGQVPLKAGVKLSAQDLQDPTPSLWDSSFSKSKRFPGNNQKGEFGSTSPLINESEFDRALDVILKSMMQEVHESMLAMF